MSEQGNSNGGVRVEYMRKEEYLKWKTHIPLSPTPTFGELFWKGIMLPVENIRECRRCVKRKCFCRDYECTKCKEGPACVPGCLWWDWFKTKMEKNR